MNEKFDFCRCRTRTWAIYFPYMAAPSMVFTTTTTWTFATRFASTTRTFATRFASTTRTSEAKFARLLSSNYLNEIQSYSCKHQSFLSRLTKSVNKTPSGMLSETIVLVKTQPLSKEIRIKSAMLIFRLKVCTKS